MSHKLFIIQTKYTSPGQYNWNNISLNFWFFQSLLNNPRYIVNTQWITKVKNKFFRCLFHFILLYENPGSFLLFNINNLSIYEPSHLSFIFYVLTNVYILVISKCGKNCSNILVFVAVSDLYILRYQEVERVKWR